MRHKIDAPEPRRDDRVDALLRCLYGPIQLVKWSDGALRQEPTHLLMLLGAVYVNVVAQVLNELRSKPLRLFAMIHLYTKRVCQIVANLLELCFLPHVLSLSVDVLQVA